MEPNIHPLSSSYRDPSGFMFEVKGVLYRQINNSFKIHLDHFIESGCYAHLTKGKLLIPHEELSENITGSKDCYKTIRPERIAFISYPYEWSFDMLKDAALLTLQVAKECLSFEVILKDATPYNVQWHEGKPIFIDTLSFEKYNAAEPWIAYRQFCESFLSPLLLMSYSNQPLQSMLLAYPDGIPIQVTKSLLPWKSKLSLHTYLHIHLHAKYAMRHRGKQEKNAAFSKRKMENLISSLQTLIAGLKWKGQTTTWENYYEEATKRNDYVDEKKKIIQSWLNEIPLLSTIADAGANEGEFSLLASSFGKNIIAADFDHAAINKMYNKLKIDGITNILPLLIDLANPSPATGLNNAERNSFTERMNADLCLALALIHHLAIGKNIPFGSIAAYFAKISEYLLIEFIPKEDEKVQFMLTQKKDIYNSYNETVFTKSFEEYFSILKTKQISNSGRILYLMKKNEITE